jgi:eukaryotic-like serine/threonine-protein kinase
MVAPAPIATPSTLEPGMVVGGDYVVGDRLSAGGMGAVYVATQRSTGVKRALKVMHPQLVSDEKLRERFAREARVSATIPSDHVVNVLAAGVDDALGIPYLAMELLDGRGLDSAVARHGPMEPALADVVLRQVAHALGAAARLGIVHRDLKPENVFVSPSRSVGLPIVVKVLDFGIAKLVAAARTSTQSMGTPLWFAPEQTDTRSTVTPATDVWAFGLLAFYLLTGHVFWEAARVEGAGIQFVLRELVIDDIPAASARAATVDRAVPPWFDAWFARCVAREPSARFGDVAEAYAHLRALRAGEPPEPSRQEMERFVAALGEGDVPARAGGTVPASPLQAPSGRTVAAARISTPSSGATAPPSGAGGTQVGTLSATLPMVPEVRSPSSPDGVASVPSYRAPPASAPRSLVPFVALGVFALLGLGGVVAGLASGGGPKAVAETESTATAEATSGAVAGEPVELKPMGAGDLSTLEKTDVKVGTGPEAKRGDTVKTHYVGTLSSGKEFDASRKHGRPFSFQLGQGRVIRGWDEGIVGMRAGGVRRLTVPPSMGYGARGMPPVIPPNATLLFEIELLEIE